MRISLTSNYFSLFSRPSKLGWLLLTLLTLMLVGCSSPEKRGIVKYLHFSEEAQTQLSDFRKDLAAIPRLPSSQRGAALREWMEKLTAKRADFEKLEVPPVAQKYNAHVQGMFQSLQDYGAESLGQANPDKLKQASDKWAEELKGANQELSTMRV